LREIDNFHVNLLEYICANNYLTLKRFDEVIAKIEGCSFLASQCRYEWTTCAHQSSWVRFVRSNTSRL